MVEIKIRPLALSEIPILDEFIYQAIFQKDTKTPLPREVITDPSIAIYINDFANKKDDHCLVAEYENDIIAAVWVRLLNGSPKGFGNVDDTTPEFSISVLPQYRNQGIGKKLMYAMLSLLQSKGYKQVSLSVQKENYAAKMYQKLGFNVVDENIEEYIMLKLLD